jgi:hypothetical protein
VIRLVAVLLALLPAPLVAGDAVTSGTGAMLRGLDKVSGQTEDFRVATGGTAEIYGLDVALGDCRYPVENPTGDAFAYLTIWERGQRQAIFDGWMIASSPALSALDHSRYDVWVIRCMTP